MNRFADDVPHSIWHRGEVAIQETVGVADQLKYYGSRIMLDHLIGQYRQFFSTLPFVVVSTVDSSGCVWATILVGDPGFLQTPDQSVLRVTASAALADPASVGLNNGDAVGLLGIDLRTRRRSRLNGRIHRIDARSFDIEVDQSYGNCPRYIHIRNCSFERHPSVIETGPAEISSSINARGKKMITDASTFFVASYVDLEDGSRQVDVSHKGGKPGFVHVADTGTVTIPDFAGNLYFNTLGNILVNPRCGLLFVDFATGDVLQLTGAGNVIFDSAEIASFHGAERLLKFVPDKVVFRKNALPMRWTSDPQGTSPHVSRTGNWTETADRLESGTPTPRN